MKQHTDTATDLIIIEQLPIITERLKGLSENIDARIDEAMALACTEDTVRVVKHLRAELNKDFAELESRRKEVKAAIMSPYEAFEDAYKTYVSNRYKDADAALKERIDGVEDTLKREKASALLEYFDEYAASRGIDFITLRQANINVTLSASLKNLKAQAKDFIDRKRDDLTLIDSQEHRDEILVEYYKTLNAPQAITMVVERHKALAAQEERRREADARKAVEQAVVEKVETASSAPLLPPVEAPTNDADPVRRLTFSVTAPLSKLRELKAFLNNGGYEYE